MKNRMRLLATYLVVAFTVFLLSGAVSLPVNLSSPGMELRGGGDVLKGDGIEVEEIAGIETVAPQATVFLSLDAQRERGASSVYCIVDSSKNVTSSPYSLNLSSWIKISNASGVDALKLSFTISLVATKNLTPTLNPNYVHNVFYYAAVNLDGSSKNDKNLGFTSDSLSISQRRTIDAKGAKLDTSIKDNQSIDLTITGTLNSDEIQDSLFIYYGGIVVILEEVIDPKYTVTFSLDTVAVCTGSTDFNCIPIIGNTIAKVGVPLTSFSSSDVSYVYREFFSNKYIPCTSAVLGNIPAFNVFSDDSAKYLDSTFRSGLTYLDQIDDSLAVNNKKHGSIGLVSDTFQPGLVPLYQGKKRIHGAQKCGGGNLSRFTYSLCLDEIVNDPNYSPDTVLCYVIPPQEDYSPCGY